MTVRNGGLFCALTNTCRKLRIIHIGKVGATGEDSVAFWIMDAWNYLLSFLSFNIKKGVPTELINVNIVYHVC